MKSERRMLKEMVREVNDTQVDIEERLSYHVYMYSRDEEARTEKYENLG